MSPFQVYSKAEKQTFPVSMLDWETTQFSAPTANATCGNLNEFSTREGYITDVVEQGYRVIQPIPYLIKRVDDIDFVASIEPVNIAIGGTSWHDAYQALVAELLDTFDTLRAEANLSPFAAAQLASLKTFLAETANNE